MNINNALLFKDCMEWHKWLAENHGNQREVWLVHFKKHSKNASIALAEAVEEAICFGWIDSKLISLDNDKFILKYTPRKANSVWSKINKERAEKLIKSGKMADAGLATVEEAKKRGLWNRAYTNKKKAKIPAGLKEALLADNNAWTNFQQFANSYRNQYINWVSGAKTEQTRLKRITEVVKRAGLNIKPG